MRLQGVKTTAAYYQEILRNPEFRSGQFNTSFVEAHPELTNYSIKRKPEELMPRRSEASFRRPRSARKVSIIIWNSRWRRTTSPSPDHAFSAVPTGSWLPDQLG